MTEPMSNSERHQMLVNALLTEPGYARTYHTSAHAKATIEQFAQLVPLMLRGLMEEAMRSDATYQRLLAEDRLEPPATFLLGDPSVMREADPTWADRYAEVMRNAPSGEAICPACGWHTKDVLREGHVCTGERGDDETPEQVQARELMTPHLERLRRERLKLTPEQRHRFVILVPADWPASVEGTLFGMKIRRAPVSRPTFSPPEESP